VRFFSRPRGDPKSQEELEMSFVLTILSGSAIMNCMSWME